MLSFNQFQTGLISKKDALALVEDPCAAGIYAYHAIKHKIAKMTSIGGLKFLKEKRFVCIYV